jgi:hypothetical protein
MGRYDVTTAELVGLLMAGFRLPHRADWLLAVIRSTCKSAAKFRVF